MPENIICEIQRTIERNAEESEIVKKMKGISFE